jgi:hypothetical protein
MVSRIILHWKVAREEIVVATIAIDFQPIDEGLYWTDQDPIRQVSSVVLVLAATVEVRHPPSPSPRPVALAALQAILPDLERMELVIQQCYPSDSQLPLRKCCWAVRESAQET